MYVHLSVRVFPYVYEFVYINIYTYVYMCVCVRVFVGMYVCMYRSYLPTPPLGHDLTQGQFLAEFNRFEFRVFLLLDYLPRQGWRT